MTQFLDLKEDSDNIEMNDPRFDVDNPSDLNSDNSLEIDDTDDKSIELKNIANSCSYVKSLKGSDCIDKDCNTRHVNSIKNDTKDLRCKKTSNAGPTESKNSAESDTGEFVKCGNKSDTGDCVKCSNKSDTGEFVKCANEKFNPTREIYTPKNTKVPNIDRLNLSKPSEEVMNYNDEGTGNRSNLDALRNEVAAGAEPQHEASTNDVRIAGKKVEFYTSGHLLTGEEVLAYCQWLHRQDGGRVETDKAYEKEHQTVIGLVSTLDSIGYYQNRYPGLTMLLEYPLLTLLTLLSFANPSIFV